MPKRAERTGLLRRLGTAQRDPGCLLAAAEVQDELLGAPAQHRPGLSTAGDDASPVRSLELEPDSAKAARHKARPAPQRGPESDLETGVVPRLEARDGPSHVLAVNEELDEVDCLVEGPPQNWGARSRPLHEAAEAVTPQRGAHGGGVQPGKDTAEEDPRHGERAALAHKDVSGEVSRQPALAQGRRGRAYRCQLVTQTSTLCRERAAIWPRASFGRQL